MSSLKHDEGCWREREDNNKVKTATREGEVEKVGGSSLKSGCHSNNQTTTETLKSPANFTWRAAQGLGSTAIVVPTTTYKAL